MKKLNTVFYYLVCIFTLLFLYSRAIASISIIALSLVSLTYILANPTRFKLLRKDFFISILLFLSLILSLLYTSNRQIGIDIIILKLPLLLCILWIPLVKIFSTKQIRSIVLIYCISVSITSIASLYNYALNYTELNKLILESKPIPIQLSYIYHIEFSVASGLAALFAIFLSLKSNTNTGKITFGILFLISIISLHILSARTGLLFFYSGIGILGLYVILKHQFKYKKLTIISALLIPIIASFTLPTIKNRLINTFQDLEVIKEGKDPNDYSMGQRVEAWTTSIYLIKQNLLMGTGVGDVKSEMDQAYILTNTRLIPINRKKPHNQILETGVQVGLVGIIILLLYMLFPLYLMKGNNILFLAFTIAYFSAMMFESLLERQTGVILFVIGYILMRHTYFANKGMINERVDVT